MITFLVLFVHSCVSSLVALLALYIFIFGGDGLCLYVWSCCRLGEVVHLDQCVSLCIYVFIDPFCVFGFVLCVFCVCDFAFFIFVCFF